MQRKQKVPGWFVGIAVLVTAAITVWAMLRWKPVAGWPDTTGQLPNTVTQVLSPAMAAMDPNRFQQVAAVQPAQPVAPLATKPPPIRAGALPPHADRGVCTLCHLVVDKVGNMIPMIQAMSNMPHPYRGGICLNCHLVSSSPATANTMTAQPVAGTVQAPTAQQAPVPSEGAWLGMEVVPITSVTAAQYRVPTGMGGLVVSEAESTAAAAGVQAGDVIVSLNSTPVVNMLSFLQATQNGALTSGVVEMLRGGKLLKLNLSPTAAPAAQNAAPQANAGQPAAYPALAMPQVPAYATQPQVPSYPAQVQPQVPAYATQPQVPSYPAPVQPGQQQF